MTVTINGEDLSDSEVERIRATLRNDAKQFAGEFHNMNRSDKFRANWPNEYEFAESEWRTFVAAVRMMYVLRLADPKTPAADARVIHLAIVLDQMASQGKESDTRLQLAPGTQQFEGDKKENAAVLDKFGNKPNFRAQLKRGVAKILPNDVAFPTSIH